MWFKKDSFQDWIFQKIFGMKEVASMVSLLNDLLPPPVPIQISLQPYQQCFESYSLSDENIEKSMESFRSNWTSFITKNIELFESNTLKMLTSPVEFSLVLFKLSNLSLEISKKVLNLLMNLSSIQPFEKLNMILILSKEINFKSNFNTSQALDWLIDELNGFEKNPKIILKILQNLVLNQDALLPDVEKFNKMLQCLMKEIQNDADIVQIIHAISSSEVGVYSLLSDLSFVSILKSNVNQSIVKKICQNISKFQIIDLDDNLEAFLSNLNDHSLHEFKSIDSIPPIPIVSTKETDFIFHRNLTFESVDILNPKIDEEVQVVKSVETVYKSPKVEQKMKYERRESPQEEEEEQMEENRGNAFEQFGMFFSEQKNKKKGESHHPHSGRNQRGGGRGNQRGGDRGRRY
jgi:hypothetical protein